VLTPADEENVRKVIGMMFQAFHAEATLTSEKFVDVMTMEVMADNLCLAAIANAARQCWRTMPKPPSIAEFLKVAEEHQGRLKEVLERLGSVAEAVDWATDVIEDMKLTPAQRFERDWGCTSEEWDDMAQADRASRARRKVTA
jgi:pantoate kinase